jgi:hypothetical protein
MVFWEPERRSEAIAAAVGSFAGPTLNTVGPAALQVGIEDHDRSD